MTEEPIFIVAAVGEWNEVKYKALSKITWRMAFGQLAG